MYEFQVTQAGAYTIETDRRMDVVMTLLGPNDQSRLVAPDDDSGRRVNAKITILLATGSYYIQVRHCRPTGAGKDNIWVRCGH